MGPFEYRAHRHTLLSGGRGLHGGAASPKKREHREKLLRTPLRVLKSAEDPELEDEMESVSIPNPVRHFDCENYETCLSLTAALNWQSFTCAGCDGTVDPVLLKKAERALHADRFLEPLIGNALIGNLTSKK